MSNPASRVRAVSLVDAVSAAIRDDILTGELPAGVPLSEQHLADRYDVARPTAKAAVERIVQEGLLHRASNKSARVPVMGRDDIRDLYSTRGLLERQVVRTLAAAPPDLADVTAAIENFRTAAGATDVADIVRLDLEFHRTLVGAVGSPRLDRMYSALIGEAHLCMAQVQMYHLVTPDEICVEHQEILDEIVARRPDAADQSLSRHLDSACRRLLAHVGTTA